MAEKENMTDDMGVQMILTVICDGIEDGSGEAGGTEEQITFLAQNAFGMSKEAVEKYLFLLGASHRVIKTGDRYQVAPTIN